MIENQASIEQLKGLSLPDSIAGYPNAIGWYLSLLVVVIAGYLATRAVLSFFINNAYRRQGLRQMKKIDAEYGAHNNDQRLLAQINQLLKTVALKAYPSAATAALSGEQWLEFLSDSVSATKYRTSIDFSSLAKVYHANVHLTDQQRSKLLSSSHCWLKQHRKIVSIKENPVV